MAKFEALPQGSKLKKQQGITKSNELIAFAEGNGVDLQLMDPYLLNDRVENEWTFNKDRQVLLEQLAKMDKEENQKNEKNHEKKAQEAKDKINSNSGKDQKKSKKPRESKSGGGFFGLFKKKDKTRNSEIQGMSLANQIQQSNISRSNLQGSTRGNQNSSNQKQFEESKERNQINDHI